MTIYLDHNATSPLRAEALDAMRAAYALGANASSVHGPGRKARAILEAAREVLGKAICARPEDIVFTAGGTEADNLALHAAQQAGVRRMIISAIEHEAVIETARHLGVIIDILPVRPNGEADLTWLKSHLAEWDHEQDGQPFLALMAVNNETGVIQPYEEAGRLMRDAGGLYLIDAVQTLGKIDFDFAASGAHFAAFSAHKVGGPQGVGALVLSCDVSYAPLIRGGGQEKSRRAGTENVAGIAGFAAAITAAKGDTTDLGALRDRARALIEAATPEVRFYGKNAPCVDNTLCLTAPGWLSEIQVIAMDLAGFAVSAGSACSSGKVRKSRVLEAMGASDGEAQCALRISLGPDTTQDDIDAFAQAWCQAYAKVRPQSSSVAV